MWFEKDILEDLDIEEFLREPAKIREPPKIRECEECSEEHICNLCILKSMVEELGNYSIVCNFYNFF
ncbi:MAG: hypothetical protein [Agile wallaby adenovirus 1]|nr:MAG: hypothetical protein [Agile wallaby atadenovirus 1]